MYYFDNYPQSTFICRKILKNLDNTLKVLIDDKYA